MVDSKRNQNVKVHMRISDHEMTKRKQNKEPRTNKGSTEGCSTNIVEKESNKAANTEEAWVQAAQG